MKWKRKVTLKTENNQFLLCHGENSLPVKNEDLYLVKAIKKGIHDENKLKHLVMEHDDTNETVAGFTLAQFILDYQEYIEDDKSHYEITF